MRNDQVCVLALCVFFVLSSAFQSDELIPDDIEFGLEGYRSHLSDNISPSSSRSPIRKRSEQDSSNSDSKIKFDLEHSFGVSEFTRCGTFTARIKTSSHGGQTLTKLRFLRNDFNEIDKTSFEKLLKDDDFYRIRLPSTVLNVSIKNYVISSVKARCLSLWSLDEHFIIHMDGVNIVAVNYGSTGACQYPRPLQLPSKWTFHSHTVLKNSEQATRTPVPVEDGSVVEGAEDEGLKPPERSFWSKYWMYLIPLGLIVINAITQAMNMPEEPVPGQPASQAQPQLVQRGSNAVARRR